MNSIAEEFEASSVRGNMAWSWFLGALDWFIPNAAALGRSERAVARNFVFTHFVGPLTSQSVPLYLYLTDVSHGVACWTIIVCVWAFWLLPFVFKWTRSLEIAATASVQLLLCVSLFGAYNYGGVNSPFLPWMIVSLLLGFFYLSHRPVLVIAMFSASIGVFCLCYLRFGFPELVPLARLSTVGWLSILSATGYMSWMAIFYANIMTMRSDLERESARHRATSVRLRQAKEAADAANRAKSIFLSKMSHEFRTPLNAVIGYSEILLEDADAGGAGEERVQDLKRINNAGKHLLSLVTEVLDISKIESDRIDLNVETFDLNALLRDIASTSKPLIGANGNAFELQAPSGLGQVSTDPTKLRQVLLNLLSNAAKFTSKGLITLTAARRRDATGDWIDIHVRDNGIGISKLDIQRLFQDYGQATPETAKKYGGTGLGLAISRRYCELMGGRISVTSELGRGSCFIVQILADCADQPNSAGQREDEGISVAIPAYAQ
jgi:signal transduction histidine kinase